MYLCLCKGIKEADVVQAGRRGVLRADQLIAVFGLEDDECCGRCADDIEEFEHIALEAHSPALASVA